MNKISLEFDLSNANQLFRLIDQSKAKLEDLAKTKISPQILNNPGAGLKVTQSITEPIRRASTQVEAINRQTALNAKRNADILTKITKQRTDAELQIEKTFEKSRERLFKEGINNRLAAMRQSTRSGGGGAGGLGSGFAGGVGVPIGAASVGVLAGAGALAFARDSINSTRDAANAQIQLQSVATETGKSYEYLRGQAAAFGNEVNLSNAVAQSTFAQLANFAEAAGRSDKLELFRKRFSDLAAAKGINASQLGDISRQLNALTDEATDKLLNANPSAFYGEFARSIGKTADSLTDAEKRASVFDAVIRKGAIFDGTAAQRANSFAGEVDGLRKTIDDLSASAGGAVAPLVSFLANATKVAVSGQSGGSSSPFWTGLANTFLNTDGANVFFGMPSSPDQFGAENYRYEEFWKKRQQQVVEAFKQSQSVITEAANKPDANILNFALSRFADREKFVNATETDRQKIIKAATEQANAYIASAKKGFENGFKLSRTGTGTPGALDDQFNSFSRIRSLLSPDEAEDLGAKFSEAYARGFRRQLDQNKGSLNLKNLAAEIRTDSALTPTDRSELLKTISEDIDKGKAKVNELKATFVDTVRGLSSRLDADNPFVKLALDGNREIDELRKNTRGLSSDLVKSLESIQNRINLRDVLRTRLSTGLEALDFRQTAEQLRNPGLSDQRIQDEQRRFVENFRASNPNFDFLTGGNVDSEEILRQFAPDFIRDPQGRRSRNFLSDRINQIERFGAAGGDQRVIADAQLVQIASQADARNLGGSDRDTLIEALERQAKDRITLELQSLQAVQNINSTLDRVASGMSALIRKAEIGGSKAVETAITVKDETSTGIRVEKQPRANQEQTIDLYGGTFIDRNTGGLRTY